MFYKLACQAFEMPFAGFTVFSRPFCKLNENLEAGQTVKRLKCHHAQQIFEPMKKV